MKINKVQTHFLTKSIYTAKNCHVIVITLFFLLRTTLLRSQRKRYNILHKICIKTTQVLFFPSPKCPRFISLVMVHVILSRIHCSSSFVQVSQPTCSFLESFLIQQQRNNKTSRSMDWSTGRNKLNFPSIVFI